MHLHQPQLAFIAIQLLKQNHISSSVGTSPASKSQILIILAISRSGLSSHNEGVVSPCRRRKRQRRFFTSVNLGPITTVASLMFHHFHKNKPASPLFVLMILLCLTSKVTCLRSKVASVAAVPSEVSETQTMDFCLDTEGERHGLFSSWQDSSSGCQCSCQPVGNALISLCDDNCDNKHIEGAEESSSLLSQNDEPYASLVHSAMPKPNTRVKPKAEKTLDKSCRDENSGNRYLDGHSWMSSVHACAKCYCVNGTTDCESSILHCQSSCLPGQRLVSTGPCCEHKCVGEPIVSKQEVSTPCTTPLGQHGEVMLRQQQCVDQRCQCINGNWFCIDTCIPLEELECPPEERIFWDPFCCPRCKGTKQCTVTVATINWLKEAPMHKGLPRFVSVFTPEGEHEVLSGPPHVAVSPGEMAASEAENAAKTSLITVEPAQHLVTQVGRCVCIEGELRCSRPGAGIWHDTDCYYSHGQGGRYYARGEHWKAHNDECSDCHCLEDRRYTCARTPCSALFLCPEGKVPVIAPGDCCPSACEDLPLDESFYQSPQAIEQVRAETVPEAPDNVLALPPILSNVGKCRPLGDLTTSNATSNIFLPSESFLIIQRPCVSLKCICSAESNWVCADYCIPCHGVPTQENDATNTLQPARPRTSDGCCPKCSESDDMERSPHFGERYSVAITCFLALLALTPLFVIVACCICLRYRQKLRKLHTTEVNRSKFHLESGLVPRSAHSSLAMPLTISTNAEGVSPPIALNETPAMTFKGRDSIHQSLLFNAKLDEEDDPLTSIKFWRLSASYSCLPDIHYTNTASTNQNFEDSSPRKSLLTATVTPSSNDTSSKVIQAHTNPCNDSSLSTSTPQLRKEESEMIGNSLDWKSRLRRNSTQPRTHFFPHAWKAMFSKSAASKVATTPVKKNREVSPFLNGPRAASCDVEETQHQIISIRNSASVDLAVISEAV